MSFLNPPAALATRRRALRRRKAGHAPQDGDDPDRPEDEDFAPEHDKT